MTLSLDFSSIGMIFASVFSECQGIPKYLHFVYSFCIVNISAGILRFSYSLKREGNDKRHPFAKGITDMLGLTTLGLGIWGIVLSFPNISYLTNPSPETCETGPMLSIFIPALIIALIIVGLIGMGLYSLLPSKKENEEKS